MASIEVLADRAIAGAKLEAVLYELKFDDTVKF
jgi:hypothetical protein